MLQIFVMSIRSGEIRDILLAVPVWYSQGPL